MSYSTDYAGAGREIGRSGDSAADWPQVFRARPDLPNPGASSLVCTLDEPSSFTQNLAVYPKVTQEGATSPGRLGRIAGVGCPCYIGLLHLTSSH
jgi:hypothetical protein